MIVDRFKRFSLLLGLFVAALGLGRFVFFIKYHDIFSTASSVAVAQAFLYGFRFDLSTVAMLVAPFFLVLFFPGVSQSRRLTRGLLIALLVWFNAILIYDFVDIEYYDFAQRHVTFEAQSAVHDLPTLLGIGLHQYLGDLVILVVCLAIFSWVYLKITRAFAPSERRPGFLQVLAVETLVLLLLIPIEVVFIRGGLQSKPMGVRSAFLNESVELGVLTLNGLYTSLFSIAERLDGRDPIAHLRALDTGNRDAERREVLARIVSDDREASNQNYPLFRRFVGRPESPQRWNVVFLILESWSAKFVGALGAEPDATPFFSQLSRDGLLMTNCFANAQRSIEGLSAILGSLPVWRGMVLGQGGVLYQTRIEPVGQVFRANGYHTLFVHGARRGSMGFDGLMRRLGIERHVSREDFEVTPTTDDGVWGIYDEYAFLRADEEMRRLPEPFYTAVFSLSSHTPYTLPSKEFERFSPEVPFHLFQNSMGYTDSALKRFFDTARQSSYFDHTLFVILGDHTEGPSTGGNLYEAYHIPCLFYAPGLVKPGRYDGVASQIDLFPSALDVVNIRTPFTSWGKSIFASGPRWALLPRGDFFVAVEAPYMLLSRLDEPIALYDMTRKPAENILPRDEVTREAADRMGSELRAYLRFSYDLILANKVRPPEESQAVAGLNGLPARP